ncbi:MAG: hypothetical protein ACC653_09745 [Gammaproteobacteria bacterium]
MLKFRIFILFFLISLNLNLHAKVSLDIHSLIAQQQYSQALAKIDQKLIRNSNNLELLYLKAQTEVKINNINQAIKTYHLIIKLYPGFPEAYNNLAGIFAKQGKLMLAKETLEKGINTNKSYALIHNNINSIYLEMARESYVKALQLGVKKHTVELNIAGLNYNTNVKYQGIPNISTKSNTSLASNSTISQKDTAVIKTRAITKQKAIGPKKTMRRVINQEVVVKAWSEPVISVKDEVITALNGWAAAWSAQDVDLYLSFYNKRFTPENGTARKIWVTQRQSRLLKPRWIEVRLSNFSFEQQSKNQAAVQATQNYRSNSFRDRSKKKFLLTRSDDGWQILNEVNFTE